MENEIRYYLKELAKLVEEGTFVPQYFVAAVTLPTGSVELIINTTGIKEKMSYMLEAYDEEMRLKTNTSVEVKNILVV